MSETSTRARERLEEIVSAALKRRSRREALAEMAPELAAVLGCEMLALYLWSEARRALCASTIWRRGPLADDGASPLPNELPANLEASALAVRVGLDARRRGSLESVRFVSVGRVEGAMLWRSGRDTSSSADRRLVDRVGTRLAEALRCLRTEEDQARSESRLDAFARLSVDLLAADDLQAVTIQLCETTRALFGVTRSALFLLDDGQLVPHAIAGPYGERAALGQLHLPPSAEPVFEEALRTREVIAVNEFTSSRYAPTPFPVPYRPQSAMAIPLFDASGLLGILTASELEEPYRFEPRDETDGRLLGAIATGALRKGLLMNDLQRASQAKSEFLASVSHELRTPLNVFLGYSEMLADGAFGPLNPDQTATLGRMTQTALTQLALVDDLLDVARIEQGKLDVRRETFRVAELVDLLSAAMTSLLRGRPIDFLTDVPETLEVCSDRDRLSQVLVNLLSNAAKFTAAGTISLTARHWDGGVELVIADTGTGIDEAVQGRETEPFVSGGAPGSRSGAGLGLAIVARVLRVLEAGFTIESTRGLGTTARIRLPGPELQARSESALRP
jgi:signal transduction histidine kinase